MPELIFFVPNHSLCICMHTKFNRECEITVGQRAHFLDKSTICQGIFMFVQKICLNEAQALAN